jgi:hypothetical protein
MEARKRKSSSIEDPEYALKLSNPVPCNLGRCTYETQKKMLIGEKMCTPTSSNKPRGSKDSRAVSRKKNIFQFYRRCSLRI